MFMNVRTATAKDIAKIKELYWQLDTDAIGFQPEHFVRGERPDEYLIGIMESPKADFLVISTGDDRNAGEGQESEIAGFSLILEKETAAISCLKRCRYAHVQDLVVASEHRNQGLGAALLEASKRWAHARGLEYLRLSVFPQNEAAIRFYTRHGLVPNMLTLECKLD